MKTFSYTTNSPYLFQNKLQAENLDCAIARIHEKLNFKKMGKSEHLPVEIWEGEKLRQDFTFNELNLITNIYK